MKVLFLLACFALIGCGGMPSPIQHPSGSFTVDFHEEQAGQVLVTSSASVPVEVHISLGESQEEATPELSFVGPLDITVQPGQTFTGPNSGFRFAAVVTDPAHVQDLQFGVKSSAVDFPVIAQFQSSDQELMGIWQASVRTIRLSMQQDQQQVIVDAPKRDHLVWSGDMYVEARVARAVFGHAADPMIKSSLVKLATSTPNCPNCGCHDINCCATYSAWWVLTVADQLDFDHDTAFVQSIPLLRVLQTMAGELNGSLFDSSKSDFGNVWVDWSPGMGTGVGQPPAPLANEIATMEFAFAFQRASVLLASIGDTANAAVYSHLAQSVRAQALAAYLDPSTSTFGDRVQTNAMAIYAGVVTDPGTIENIFQSVLAKPPAPSQPVSPYGNYFTVSALIKAGHPDAARQLIKEFWGGMLNTGTTTTFWELYSPQCVGNPAFHSCLNNYQKSLGELVGTRLGLSLSHGWSSGPAELLLSIP